MDAASFIGLVVFAALSETAACRASSSRRRRSSVIGTVARPFLRLVSMRSA